MSQRNVEQVIGRLVTDESFRTKFAADPGAAIQEIAEAGCELTAVERRALASVDLDLLGKIADGLDPRLQKIARCGGCG